MFASFGFEAVTAPQAAVWFGAALGLLFGFLAQRSRFCLRRGLAGDAAERRPALGVWVTALASALIGTQVAVAAGWIDFSTHRYLAGGVPVVAIIAGGLMFGTGMVLTRGCISRLTVLSGQGNLRALSVLAIFAVAAHATLKGVLSPVRTGLGSVSLPMGEHASLAALPGGPLVWTALLALAALAFAARSGAPVRRIAAGALIGLLVPVAWVGTGLVLYDDFDPIALESLSFTAPWAETLFWGIASTSIAASFGVGLTLGAIGGSAVAATLFREFRWESFSSPAQMGRSMAGAMLMGVGGVLAGGCTVGAGLAGSSTLSVAALMALASIVLGAKAAVAAAGRSEAGLAVPAQ